MAVSPILPLERTITRVLREFALQVLRARLKINIFVFSATVIDGNGFFDGDTAKNRRDVTSSTNKNGSPVGILAIVEKRNDVPVFV